MFPAPIVIERRNAPSLLKNAQAIIILGYGVSKLRAEASRTHYEGEHSEQEMM